GDGAPADPPSRKLKRFPCDGPPAPPSWTPTITLLSVIEVETPADPSPPKPPPPPPVFSWVWVKESICPSPSLALDASEPGVELNEKSDDAGREILPAIVMLDCASRTSGAVPPAKIDDPAVRLNELKSNTVSKCPGM